MKLNFEKLMNLNPTEYRTVINSIGQKVTFIEHPTKGDEAPVIAVFKEEQKAFYTDFYELGEIDGFNGEYEVMLINGEIQHGK
jgi:hypothetical protein